jgi:hypothetical protein
MIAIFAKWNGSPPLTKLKMIKNVSKKANYLELGLPYMLEFAPSAGFFAWDKNIEPDYGMSGSLGFRYWF